MIKQLLPPRIVLFASFFILTLAAIPFAVIAWTRSAPSPGRPIHIIQDMDYQPRFDTQEVNPLFADDRAMRPQIGGVVPRKRKPSKFKASVMSARPLPS